MLINIKDKVDYKNFITILKLMEGTNSIDVTGKDKGKINNVNIKNIIMEQYCNIFQASHFTPNNKFNLTNINMDGRFNIIELIDLPKGTYIFDIKNNFEEDTNSEVNNTQVPLDKIDKILKTIEKSDKTLLVKNKSHNNFEIKDYDLKEYKVYYLKNISGDSRTPTINIDYHHDNLKLIVDSTVARIIVNNKSTSRIDHKKILKNKIIDEEVNMDEMDELDEMYEMDELDEMDEIERFTKEEEEMEELDEIEQFTGEEEDENEMEEEGEIETFGNSCTSSGQTILILIILFFVFKLVTRRQTIKLFY